MKVAYIDHHKRPNYEFPWFSHMPVDNVIFITTDAPATVTHDAKVEHRIVGYEEKGWENRLFASTALRVFYTNFEQALEDVDVVVVLEVFSSLSRQFVSYCKAHGIPVVVLVYELIETHPIYKIPRYRGNTKYVLNHADHFVAVSHAAADHLVKLGAPKDRISVVYPGIDLRTFRADHHKRKAHGLSFVGRLDPHKGADIMLRVYERLLHDIPDVTLDIVGNGGQRSDVIAFAETHAGVTYIGNSVPNAELPSAILNKTSIYVLPARDTKKFGQRIGAEQFGFSIVEAMACGLAVATTECGALPEIVTDKNIIVAQNDEDALYSRIKSLLQDPAKLASVGAYNQRLAAERYDLNTQAAAFAAVLQTVCRKR